MTKVKLQTNVVFDHLDMSDKRFIVEQGGTRSGKTYNILIWIIFKYCMTNTGKTITICRKHGPSLRGSSMRDFFELLMKYNLYSEDRHSKSTNEYKLNGNLIEFVSLDEPQKIRGRKRHLLFINEGNELRYEDFFQLNIRTIERVVVDYNPSDEFHWLYEKLIPREDCDFHITTYKDNPFLDQQLVDEIERLQGVDANYWRVYGQGQRGTSKAIIFTHWNEVDQVPEGFKLYNIGLDFGYTNDPSAIVCIYSDGESFLMDEILYARKMSNIELAKILMEYKVPVIADCAEPKSIDEIHKYGVNIYPCQKGADSVRSGIQFLKSKKLFITSRSVNGIKELRNYKYHEDKNGKMTNQPVDAFNHFIDASRYAITWRQLRPNYGQYAVG